MFGGEVEEGEQLFPILHQAVDRFVVFLGEDVDRLLGIRPIRRRPDLAEVMLDLVLDGFRHLVEHVCGLVHRAPLVASSGEDLVERLPEPKRAITRGELGRDGQALALEADQKLLPFLFTY